MDFTAPLDRSVQIKEGEKIKNIRTLLANKKCPGIIIVIMISIVVDELGTIQKSLEKELEDFEIRGRIKTIQTTVLLRTSRRLRIVQEAGGDLLSLTPKWKTTSQY